MNNTKESFITEMNKEWNESNSLNLSSEEMAELYWDALSDYDTVVPDSNDSHRWYDEFLVIKKVGDKLFQYSWGSTNTENSLEDCGFYITSSIDNMIEVEEYEETIVTKMYRPVNHEE